jgi:hypothetical protein
MTKYLFKNRGDVQNLLELVDNPRKPKMKNFGISREGSLTSGIVNRGTVATTGWIFKTPTDGIPAIGTVTPDEPGRADCTAYFINYIDELDAALQPTGVKLPRLEPLFATNGDSIILEILNIFSTDIAGDTFITVKEVFRRLVVDAEDCPVGGAATGTEGVTGGSGGVVI